MAKGAGVSVLSSGPTLIATGEGATAQVTIQVPSGTTVYVGDSATSSTSGISLVGPVIQQFLVGPHDLLYAKASTGTAALTVLVMAGVFS